ncbi:MAG: J domain-containing protein [Cyanobacteria bacterium]|nr:J domain-containing protein [Cyanobacteriota bacterium]
MQNFRNYFEILGVEQGASQEQIKQGYRQMARKYHPDLNPGDKQAEETFKLLGEAYEVLSDPVKRGQYEEYSRFWNQKGFRQGKPQRNSPFPFGKVDFGEFGDFNRFIDQLLNRRGESGADAPQAPWSSPPPVSNAGRAAAGADPYQRPAEARDRRATATAEAAPRSPSAATTARRQGAGTGRGDRSPLASRRDAEANLTLPLEKAYSGGQERIRLEDGRSLEVDMPPGMVTGQRIRLKGQGIGGGNLYLRIEVEPHPLFVLQGNDVVCQIPITPSEAALGGPIEVPTLDGLVKMTLPAGVQTGRRLRLAGKGYPYGQHHRGDQIVELRVVVPEVLSDRERALYSELRETEPFNPRDSLMPPRP